MKLKFVHIIGTLILSILICLFSSISKPQGINAKVRLVEVALTPDCGYFAFATTQKFEVLTGNIPDWKGRYILIIEQCPEFLGRNFFQKDSIYDVILSREKPTSTNYFVLSKYKNEQLPTFWCSQIKKALSLKLK